MKITEEMLRKENFSDYEINRYRELTGFRYIKPSLLMELLYKSKEINILFWVFNKIKHGKKTETISCNINSRDLLFSQSSLTINGSLKAGAIMVKGDLIINSTSLFDTCLGGDFVMVSGNIISNKTIDGIRCDLCAGGDIICEGQINAGSSIRSGGNIKSKYCITAKQIIKAKNDIEAGTNISSYAGTLVAGNKIKAGRFIEAGFMIKCKSIFANNHGIYIGKYFEVGKMQKAVLIAEKEPKNLQTGRFKHINEPLTLLEKDLFNY